EHIALMRHNHRHAGADVFALHERGMPDRDTGDIRDRVQRTGLEHTGCQADRPRTRPHLLSGQLRDHQPDGNRENYFFHRDPHPRTLAPPHPRTLAPKIRCLLAMRQIPLDAITDAAKHVYKAAVRTPLVKLDLPFASGNGPVPEVYLKLESLQPIGSFKIRGAWNAVRKLTPEQMKDGVWTVSAGNAAQGVAFAARLAGVPCSVMVMDTAPQTKLRSIEKLGATIVKATYDECWQTVEAHASNRMRGHFVHPFDDDDF